jgi:hypothetical protein
MSEDRDGTPNTVTSRSIHDGCFTAFRIGEAPLRNLASNSEQVLDGQPSSHKADERDDVMNCSSLVPHNCCKSPDQTFGSLATPTLFFLLQFCRSRDCESYRTEQRSQSWPWWEPWFGGQ